MVDIYEPLPGETAMLYEMGMPVVETGDKFHVNVQQKVPLNMDRDNVTPGYLRDVRTLVVNAMHEQLDETDANATFVNEALADEQASPEAVKKALDLKFSESSMCREWRWFGWEMAIARRIGAWGTWSRHNARYGIGDAEWGELPAKRRQTVIADRVRYAKRIGILNKTGEPRSIR
jgi:hypothetical protein